MPRSQNYKVNNKHYVHFNAATRFHWPKDYIFKFVVIDGHNHWHLSYCLFHKLLKKNTTQHLNGHSTKRNWICYIFDHLYKKMTSKRCFLHSFWSSSNGTCTINEITSRSQQVNKFLLTMCVVCENSAIQIPNCLVGWLVGRSTGMCAIFLLSIFANNE